MCKQMTRYAFLRQSVAYFAASAEEQLAHDMGADDAVNDIPFPLEDMFECGELTQAEIELIRPLEDLIKQYCSSPGLKPWSDEAALRADPSWAQIRSLAIHVLGRLPDECRENDASRRPSNDC